MATDKELTELLLNRARSGVEGYEEVQETISETNSFFHDNHDFEMGDNRVKFSEVFGFTPTTIPDIPVPKYEAEHWPVEVRSRIPQQISTYYFNQETLEKVMYAFYCEGTFLLYGPTGTGKTSILEQICAKCTIPFLRVSCHGQMEASEFLGANRVETDPESNTPITKHCDTDTTLAFKYGGVLVIDEAFRAPAHCLMTMQSGLEYPHVLNLQDAQGIGRQSRAPEHDFWLALTDNTNGTGDTTGKFMAEVQDISTLNRVRRAVYVDYLPANEEFKLMLKAFPEIPHKTHKDMIKVADNIRKAFTGHKLQQTMSIRELLSWGQSIMHLRDIKTSFEFAVFQRLQDTDKEVVADIYRQVFGETL